MPGMKFKTEVSATSDHNSDVSFTWPDDSRSEVVRAFIRA